MHDMVIKLVEKPLLEVVMAKADGNQSKAARTLNLSRGALIAKIKDGMDLRTLVTAGTTLDHTDTNLLTTFSNLKV